MTDSCSLAIWCGNDADRVVPAPDGSDYPICDDCYASDCGRCSGPIEDDSNVAKGLCQSCRDEIDLWGGDEEKGVEKEPDTEQTTLLTDGGHGSRSRSVPTPAEDELIGTLERVAAEGRAQCRLCDHWVEGGDFGKIFERLAEHGEEAHDWDGQDGWSA